MSFASPLALTRRPCQRLLCNVYYCLPPTHHQQTRCKSSSPYGRAHVTHRRAPTLPPPSVPEFPQVVVRSDGSSFTHYTTSPRSRIRLTRDLTNNPMWNSGMWADDKGTEEEDESTGRLGRFQRKYEELDWASLDTTTTPKQETEGEKETKDKGREAEKTS